MPQHTATQALWSLVITGAAHAGAATTFDGALIAGEWIDDSGVFDTFAEVVDPNLPEYFWTGEDTPFDGFAVNLGGSSVEFRYSTLDFEYLYYAKSSRFIFTDVDDVLADFESVALGDSRGDGGIDWSLLELGVLDANSFYVDFAGVASDGDTQRIFNDDFFVMEMTFVPTPAAAPLLIAGAAFAARRRRR